VSGPSVAKTGFSQIASSFGQFIFTLFPKVLSLAR
jgi:hypothetical protein